MMKVECNVGVMLKAAQSVSPAISGKSSLPILRHVKIEAGETATDLTLFGTDLEMGIRASSEADVKEAGEIAPDAKMLTALLSKLPASATISLEGSGNHSITAICLKSRYNLAGADPSEIPTYLSGNGDLFCFDIGAEELSRAIEQTSYAVSIDKARANINGQLLQLSEDGTLTIVATDTHRLCVRTISLSSFSGSGSVVVPAAFFSALKGYLKTAPVSFSFSPSTIWASIPEANIEIYSRLIAQQYPNYQRVIPSSQISAIRFDREEMISAVERVMLVAEDNSNKVIFEPEGMFLKAWSESATDKAQEEVTYSAERAEMPKQVGINGKYLLACLNSFRGKEAQMEFSTELRPVTAYDMTAEGKDEVLTVALMPMQIV